MNTNKHKYEEHATAACGFAKPYEDPEPPNQPIRNPGNQERKETGFPPAFSPPAFLPFLASLFAFSTTLDHRTASPRKRLTASCSFVFIRGYSRNPHRG